MSGPGAVCRRVGSSGKVASSSAGRPSGSSVGVGACTTCAVRGTAGAPSRVHRDRPGHRPDRAQPLLHRAVGEQVGGERSAGGVDPPAGGSSAGAVLDQHVAVVELTARQRPCAGGGFDDHLGQAGQREQQRVVHGGEQTDRQVLGGAVAQRQDDDRVVRVRGAALRGERQPQQRDMAVPAAQLLVQAGDVRRPAAAGLGQRPAHAAGAAEHGGLVADREDRGEADAEAADDRVGGVVALGGGAQRGQRLDGGGVQRGAGVRGGEARGGVRVGRVGPVQRQPQPAGDAGPGGGVGGVLGQLHDQAVAVAAEGEVLLGVGVLPEPGGGGGPGGQDGFGAGRSYGRGRGCSSGVVRVTPGRLTDGLPCPVPAGCGPGGAPHRDRTAIRRVPACRAARAGRPRLPR